MSRLAKEYHLSDVGLAKICTRHQIPRPGLGYWARLAHGKKDQQVPLPAIPPGELDTVEIVLQEKSEKKPAFEGFEDTRAELARIATLAPPVVVDSVKKLKHPLVLRMNEVKQSYHHGFEGWISHWRLHPDVNVTTSAWDRALRILDAQFRCAEERGYKVHVEDGKGTFIKVLGEDVQIAVREKRKRVEASSMPQDRESVRLNHQEYEFIGTGALWLSIKNDYDAGRGRLNWFDSDDSRLDGKLADFMSGLVESAARLRRRRLDIQERERRRSEEARLSEERRKEVENGAKLVQGLIKEAEKWNTSQSIRAFIEARKKAEVVRNGDISPSSEFGKWFEWAMREADKMDPLAGDSG
jgi:hypothetical protein